jgi:hypothetical protein
MLLPSVHELESRRLLSLGYSYLGYTGVDLTGPTAAAGPDGIQDLGIEVTGLPASTFINAVTINGPAPSLPNYPSGFTWTYGPTSSTQSPNGDAGPGIQVLVDQVSGGETANIYFSPVVQQISSTGQITDQPLPSDTDESQPNLSVSVSYGSSQPYTFSFASLASSPALADVLPSLPALNYAQFRAIFQGQSTTTGFASIQITGLPQGSTLSSVTLSDVAGREWGFGQSYGRGELGLTIAYASNNTVATITFPPYRDEAGTAMTLTYQLPVDGVLETCVTDVAVPAGDHTDPSLLGVNDNNAYGYPSPYSTNNP